jgi:hypothetical protein
VISRITVALEMDGFSQLHSRPSDYAAHRDDQLKCFPNICIQLAALLNSLAGAEISPRLASASRA